MNSLDIRNGNNTATNDFQAQNNPDLSCIYVDDVAYANANWTKDATATFTNNDSDYDSDGICDDADPDDDNDGVLDGDDSCPQGDLGWTSDVTTDADADGCQDATEDFTSIPDANFEQALIDDGIDTDGLINQKILNRDAIGVELLDVSSKMISDLSGIEAFTDLTFLNCLNNQLSTLDLSHNIALQQLLCGSNQLSSLNVTGNGALIRLECSLNALSSLDVSNSTGLQNLGCSGNQLSSLDLSQNTALQQLNCSNNQLSSLNISGATSLWQLVCGTNQLASLDVQYEHRTSDPEFGDKSTQPARCEQHWKLRETSLRFKSAQWLGP